MAGAGFGKRGTDSDVSSQPVVAVSAAPPTMPAKEQQDWRYRKIAFSIIGAAGVLLLLKSLMLTASSSSHKTTEQHNALILQDGWTIVSIDNVNVKIPGEPQVTYTVIGAANMANGKAISMHSRYSQQSGWNYTTCQYDCGGGNLFDVGLGDTIEAMHASKPDGG